MVQSSTQPQRKPRPRARLPDPVRQCLATVTLGRPSSPDCRHYGICRIEIASAASVFSPDFVGQQMTGCGDKVVALLSYQPPDCLEVALLNSTVSTAVFERHFADGLFLIKEDYALPEWCFGLSLVIESGSYNIAISDSLLRVQIPVHPLTPDS